MYNWVRQIILLLRFESIVMVLNTRLFESEGQIETKELVNELASPQSLLEQLLIAQLIINQVDCIMNSVPAFSIKDAGKLLKELRKTNTAILQEPIWNRADLKLVQLRAYFERGRKAAEERPASFEAMRYQIELDDKRPLSKKDIEALGRISKVQDRLAGF